MPVRKLPPSPSLEHLKRQARDLLAECAAGRPQACQRLREFHPMFAGLDDDAIAASRLSWSDGLFAIAREYGFASWPRLKAHVASPDAGIELPYRDRIADQILRQAVDLIDDGDIDALRRLLDQYPDLVLRRADFEGGNYFRTPALLAFVAENPVRNDCLPPNIVAIAELLLARGATDIDETLGLVASGRVAREAGVQVELIALLCRHRADPNRAMTAALAHGEFEAVDALRGCGAGLTLPAAAALGDREAASALLPGSDATDRHLALALSAQHGHAAILELLLERGEDPNRYNPVAAHAHSTPLHQAAWHGHADAVRVLLAHNARSDLADTLWNGTARDWALHAGHASIADLLESDSV